MGASTRVSICIGYEWVNLLTDLVQYNTNVEWKSAWKNKKASYFWAHTCTDCIWNNICDVVMIKFICHLKRLFRYRLWTHNIYFQFTKRKKKLYILLHLYEIERTSQFTFNISGLLKQNNDTAILLWREGTGLSGKDKLPYWYTSESFPIQDHLGMKGTHFKATAKQHPSHPHHFLLNILHYRNKKNASLHNTTHTFPTITLHH